jgi:hypothetical protein
MAQRTILIVEDDIDGSPAAETVSFILQGIEYQLDLSDKNLAKFNKALDPYLSAARRVGGRKRTGAAKPRGDSLIDNRAVRAWAESHGIEVSSRGRISAVVIEQYRAAGN